tara:strand:- start:961 stop:1173 length:213 start_codon:yes stop_codon:yes gene_type:complete
MSKVLTLRQYIDDYHDGNQAAFARQCGKHEQHVYRQLLSCDFIVVDGKVAQIKYPVKPVNNEKKGVKTND